MNRVLSNRILFILALGGLGVAVLLTIKHVVGLNLPCGASHGCDVVANHPTAWGFGLGWPLVRSIPTAAFGVMMFLVLVVLAMLRAAGPSPAAERTASGLQWLLSAAGVLVAAYLTYLEAAVIHAWCIYCVATAIITVLTFLTATLERVVPAPSLQGDAS